MRRALSPTLFGAFLLPVLLAPACQLPQPAPTPEYLQPARTITLPRILNEVSGLAVAGPDLLLAVQDEEGDLFGVNPEDGEVLFRAEFAGDGDFEGLDVSGDSVYVLRSDPRVWVTAIPNADGDIDARRQRIDLHGSCDAEGLAVHPATGELWLSCKESPGRGVGRVRAIWASPFYAADEAEPRLALRMPPPTVFGSDEPMRRGLFKPSGLLFNAAGDHLLVLSASSRTLHAYALPEIEPIASWALDPDVFPQPEALAQAADGTLYVATEARGGRAVIGVFPDFPF
ncbi:MAG: SdiA-regulated domain-containing protein [Rhodothermales bacterium]|nr:SdiA-regulated domain-containing protein [Rhodothermales bacterium]